jgi:hypothetical protein
MFVLAIAIGVAIATQSWSWPITVLCLGIVVEGVLTTRNRRSQD